MESQLLQALDWNVWISSKESVRSRVRAPPDPVLTSIGRGTADVDLQTASPGGRLLVPLHPPHSNPTSLFSQSAELRSTEEREPGSDSSDGEPVPDAASTGRAREALEGGPRPLTRRGRDEDGTVGSGGDGLEGRTTREVCLVLDQEALLKARRRHPARAYRGVRGSHPQHVGSIAEVTCPSLPADCNPSCPC